MAALVICRSLMLCSFSFRFAFNAPIGSVPIHQDMEKGEQPTGCLQIDPGSEAFSEQLGCFVVDGPASHVDGLEPLGHRAGHCIRVAVADKAIILKQPAERGERQTVTKDWCAVLGGDGYNEPSVGQGKTQPIGSAVVTNGCKAIIVQEVEVATVCSRFLSLSICLPKDPSRETAQSRKLD